PLLDRADRDRRVHAIVVAEVAVDGELRVRVLALGGVGKGDGAIGVERAGAADLRDRSPPGVTVRSTSPATSGCRGGVDSRDGAGSGSRPRDQRGDSRIHRPTGPSSASDALASAELSTARGPSRSNRLKLGAPSAPSVRLTRTRPSRSDRRSAGTPS